MQKSKRFRIVLTPFVALILSGGLSPALCQDSAELSSSAVAPVGASVTALIDIDSYWTPARMAHARPMPLPGVSAETVLSVSTAEGGASGIGLGLPYKLPAVGALTHPLVLFESIDRSSAEMAEPLASGPAGFRFTSSRLVGDQIAKLGGEKKFPNTIEGQIFFTVPPGTSEQPGDYICSGTVQTIGIVVTAGHCVTDGHGHFFTNWRFVPALRSGKAPFGTFNAAVVYTTATFFNGGGVFPNAQDVAVLVIAVGRSRRRIGSLTGWAGFFTLDLFAGQHVTALGYPSNIDNATIDHRTDAQVFAGSNNTDLIGTDAGPGSSGGGWFANFGEYGVGQPLTGTVDSFPYILVAVTSYGPSTGPVSYQGASILDSRYVECLPLNTCSANPTALLNFACVKNPGSC